MKLIEFPESADEQRNQFVQRQEAKAADCDVFYSDVIWTAEFAQQKWLYDMTPYVESRQDEFIPSTLATITYQDKQWGVPHKTNAGFLYYRTDQVDKAPKTWQEVYDVAAKNDGIAYQGASYEGLTVNFLELAFAAGGKVLSDDGTKAEIDSPENVKALKFMVDGIKSGAAPKAVTTYMEEPARRTFESGKATFMRNWPYCYALAQKAPKTKGKFAVVPFPAFEGARQGRHPRRRQPRDLDVLEEPRRVAEVHRLHDAPGAPERGHRQVLRRLAAEGGLRGPGGQEGAAVLGRAQERGRAGQDAPGLARSTRRSRAAIYKNVNKALSGNVVARRRR